MTKVISLSDDAYFMLKDLKEEGESFSDVVRKIAKKKDSKSIMDCAGILKDSSEEWEKISKEIYKDRKNFKMRDYSL